MPVLALEVEPAPLVQVVDLPVRPRARPAPEDDSLVHDPLQDSVELLVRGQEGVVIGTRVVRVIEVQSQYVVDLDRREVTPQGPSYLSPNMRAMNSADFTLSWAGTIVWSSCKGMVIPLQTASFTWER